MATSKTRQRKLAREKMERRLVRQAEATRRSRQRRATVGVIVAVLVVGFGTAWALGAFTSKPKVAPVATCIWNQADPSDTSLTDVGTPPTDGEPRNGTDTLTLNTNHGQVVAQIDLTQSPCAGSSIQYLTGKGFYNNTTCHRLVNKGAYLLQCGDPTGTGHGGPKYTFLDENPATANTPSAAPSASTAPSASAAPSASPSASQYSYPAGTVAMFSAAPDSNGSQFMIFYQDSVLPVAYDVVGEVTLGLTVIKDVAAGGIKGNSHDGTPNTTLTLTSVTVLTPTGVLASAAPSAPPSASPSPSAAASPGPSASAG